jgi:hypothetical protein
VTAGSSAPAEIATAIVGVYEIGRVTVIATREDGLSTKTRRTMKMSGEPTFQSVHGAISANALRCSCGCHLTPVASSHVGPCRCIMTPRSRPDVRHEALVEERDHDIR